MTIEERANQAAQWKATGIYNCAQAVTQAFARQLVAGFQEKCGATICKDLKGIETGRVLCSCPECVRNAVLTLGEVLKLEEKV